MIATGSLVYCTENKGETKTKYTVQFCEEQREDGTTVTVASHPFLAEKVALALLERKLVSEFGDYNVNNILKQQTYGKSRVDFVLENIEEKTTFLVEVKNVVGADYIEGNVPLKRGDVGVYTQPRKNADGSMYERHAIFPHGTKKNKVGVISDRAIKHLHELTNIQGTMDKNNRKIQSCMLFIINRSDCESFRPCHEADLVFAQVLLKAHENNVILIAKEIIWINGRALAGRTLPVKFDENIIKTSDIDNNHLLQILLFNENGSGRTPSPKKKKDEIELEELESKEVETELTESGKSNKKEKSKKGAN